MKEIIETASGARLSATIHEAKRVRKLHGISAAILHANFPETLFALNKQHWVTTVFK